MNYTQKEKSSGKCLAMSSAGKIWDDSSERTTVGYDLDGVIAPASEAAWLTRLWSAQPFLASLIHASLVSSPLFVPTSGIIITGRGGHLRSLTKLWLHRHGIDLPLVMTKMWHTDRDRSRRWKLDNILQLGVRTFYEDDAETVEFLRSHLPPAVQVIRVHAILEVGP